MMYKIQPTIVFLFIFIFTSCNYVKHYNNRIQDLESATKIIDSFFVFEKQERYNELYNLFTTGNSGLTKKQLNDKLSNIINETKSKDGFIKKRIDIKSTSNIQESNSKITGEYYVEVINERSLINTKETFKLMRLGSSIKIYDYQILVGANNK